MKHLAYIDEYFKSTEPAVDSREFEQKLLDDTSFAEEVAFYLTTQRLLQEKARNEKIERFRKLYDQQPVSSSPLRVVRPVNRIWRYVAAAAVIVGLIFTINLLLPVSKQQMADRYIRQELLDLDVSMNGAIDSVQEMRDLYNQGKLSESLAISEAIINNNRGNLKALEYAGVINLRLQKYDEALRWFKQLSEQKAYSNKGVFYQAVTLMKRNQPGDLPLAKSLLDEVVKNDLDGKAFAEKWLEKW
jgi:tetratricopeptide (TPR) repeat protein